MNSELPPGGLGVGLEPVVGPALRYFGDGDEAVDEATQVLYAVEWLDAKYARHGEREDHDCARLIAHLKKLADARLEQMQADRRQALRWRDAGAAAVAWFDERATIADLHPPPKWVLCFSRPNAQANPQDRRTEENSQ